MMDWQPIETSKELLDLLEKAKAAPPMTPAERYWQRRSWLIGEMGFAEDCP